RDARSGELARRRNAARAARPRQLRAGRFRTGRWQRRPSYEPIPTDAAPGGARWAAGRTSLGNRAWTKPPDRLRIVESLELERLRHDLEAALGEPLPDPLVRLLAENDLPGLCRCLQAGRQVRGRPQDRHVSVNGGPPDH